VHDKLGNVRSSDIKLVVGFCRIRQGIQKNAQGSSRKEEKIPHTHKKTLKERGLNTSNFPFYFFVEMGGVFSALFSLIKNITWMVCFLMAPYLVVMVINSILGVETDGKSTSERLIMAPSIVLAFLWVFVPVYFDIVAYKLLKLVPRYTTGQWLVNAQKQSEIVYFESEELARSAWISCMHNTHIPLADYKMVLVYKDTPSAYRVRNAWAEQGSVHIARCASLNKEGVFSELKDLHAHDVRTAIGPKSCPEDRKRIRVYLVQRVPRACKRKSDYSLREDARFPQRKELLQYT
jgi:hypothetical protein